MTSAETGIVRARLGLSRSIVLFALLHAACRFVPFPFMDEWLKVKALQQVVRRTLARHEREYEIELVSPLWTVEEGCVASFFLLLPKLLLKLVLFPIRKVLSWLGAIRGVTRDVMTGLLLARSLERVLAAGRLSGDDAHALRGEATQIRAAFDSAMKKSDLGVLRGAVRSVFASRRGLLRALARSAGSLLSRSTVPSNPEDELPSEDRAAVSAGADALERALDASEIRAELQRFDARFDEALGATAPALAA